MTQPIPNGYHAVTPSFTFKDSGKAIEFYKKAFNAKVLDLFPNLNGPGIMHATIQIGNSILMMGDEMPASPAGKPSESCAKSAETTGSSPISLYLYVQDADQAFQQAVAAGGTVAMPVMDMFWGDRAGQVKDPFGYLWMIATHKRDMSQDEIKKEARAFFASFEKK